MENFKLSKASRKRFFERIEKQTNGCWIWTGAISDTGYGKACIGHQRTMNAHKLMYLLVKGPVEEGFYVCHTCDNRACVNPEHLFKGSPHDNIHDMITKGRAKFPNPRYGQLNPSSKLTWKEVRKIRKEYQPGVVTMKELGKKYGVTGTQIRHIVRNIHWIEGNQS